MHTFFLFNGPCISIIGDNRLLVKRLDLLFTAELLCYNIAMAAKKGKGSGIRNSDRQNGKAFKKRPKMFDPAKRRLVSL